MVRVHAACPVSLLHSHLLMIYFNTLGLINEQTHLRMHSQPYLNTHTHSIIPRDLVDYSALNVAEIVVVGLCPALR